MIAAKMRLASGRLNMAVHPVMPMNMPQAHIQHVVRDPVALQYCS